jgi:subtilisin family serine protease
MASSKAGSMVRLAVLFALVSVRANAAVVAIVDSGVDYKHPDLAAKIWSNKGEVADNRKDDDKNGYVDDIRGWNFAEGNNQIIDYKYLGQFSPDVQKFFAIQKKIVTGTATEEEKTWYKSKKEDKEFLAELGKFGNFVHGTTGNNTVQMRMKTQILSPSVQNSNHSHLEIFVFAKRLKRFPSRFK